MITCAYTYYKNCFSVMRLFALFRRKPSKSGKLYLAENAAEARTEHFDLLKLGQELDPFTGVPSRSSEWYSSTMLFYLYAARRIEKQNEVK